MMWAVGFVPLVIMLLYLLILKRSRNWRIKSKGLSEKRKEIEMSRLLKELIGKTPTIVGQVFGTDNWEVVDVDEEWVKLRSVDKEEKKNNCNALRISKQLNLTESRCVTCN